MSSVLSMPRRALVKKLGAAGFAVFLIKGLVWLALAIVAYLQW